jgi:fatty acid synthase subunit alpha, fungi type
VATKGAIVKDEPIKELLGGMNETLISRLLETKYGGDKNSVPVVNYLGNEPYHPSALIMGVHRSESNENITYAVSSPLPDTDSWLELLSGSQLNWLRALIASPTIVQGTSYIDNPLRRILAPRSGQKVIISGPFDSPKSVSVFGAARSYGVHNPDFKSLEIIYNSNTHAIDVTLFEERLDVAVPLKLHFFFKPSTPYALIHEVAEGRNTRIKEFYWKLWYGDNETLPEIDIHETFVGPEVTLDADDIETFCAVVGNQTEAFKAVRSEEVQAPMDFAIVAGWKVCSLVSCYSSSSYNAL